jgi:hypothetical protein
MMLFLLDMASIACKCCFASNLAFEVACCTVVTCCQLVVVTQL